MRKCFDFFINVHLFKTFVNFFRMANETVVVKYTTIFFGNKAQAITEYLVLVVIFALLTLISVSKFFVGEGNLVDYLRNNFFAPAVDRILR